MLLHLDYTRWNSFFCSPDYLLPHRGQDPFFSTVRKATSPILTGMQFGPPRSKSSKAMQNMGRYVLSSHCYHTHVCQHPTLPKP